MTTPPLTDRHRQLERLAGRWQGTETMHPSPWDPEGGEARGTNDNRLALNGLALITDYEQQRDGKTTFLGHGVMSYDSQDGCFVLHWLDSMGSPMEIFRGDFEGDVLTLSHGGEMHARLIWDLSREGVLGSSMEMSPDGEQWSKLFECDYERA